MSITLRIILIIGSFLSFLLCVRKIKQSKLKVENSVTWMLGSILLILMSIFSNVVGWLSNLLGFVSPVNFVFLIMIAFLLVQTFIDNMNITALILSERLTAVLKEKSLLTTRTQTESSEKQRML